jgi:glycosyltransferase involved in cell wall biosynthesis
MNSTEKKNNTKIRILYVNNSINIGGIETLILELARRIDRNVYVPYICVFEKSGALQDEFKNSGVTVLVAEKKSGIDCSIPFKIAGSLKEHDIDIVHTHNQSSWLYACFAAFLHSVPLVHTVHTTFDYIKSRARRWRRIEWFLALFTKRLIAVAGSISDYLHSKQGIPERKIQVIYNGVKTDEFDISVNIPEKRKEAGLSEQDYVVGNVARFYPNKDHMTLVNAFANRRDVPQLLHVFDLFVLSSLREGLPVAILEAMAAGIPVVATDVDGNSELVLNGETGVLVKSGDSSAIAQSISGSYKDRDSARRMAENARERIKGLFSFEGMSRRYEDVYREVLKREAGQ